MRHMRNLFLASLFATLCFSSAIAQTSSEERSWLSPYEYDSEKDRTQKAWYLGYSTISHKPLLIETWLFQPSEFKKEGDSIKFWRKRTISVRGETLRGETFNADLMQFRVNCKNEEYQFLYLVGYYDKELRQGEYVKIEDKVSFANPNPSREPFVPGTAGADFFKAVCEVAYRSGK